MNLAVAAVVTAAFAGGVQSGNGGLDSSHFGVSESPQDVYVKAQGAAASAPATPQSSSMPPPDCWLEPDSSYGAPPPGSQDGGTWLRWRCSNDPQKLTRIPRDDLESWAPKPTSSPKDVAREAVKAIHLPAPVMRVSPGADSQWVNFPVFLWTDSAAWHPLSATASVPGLAVSATAAPVRIAWDMGDGTTVTCAGPGTPFTDAMSAAASSPDCGHVYRRASDAEPSGKFTVRATETWRVTWVGGGQSGTLPDMTATSSIAVRVAESQALVTSVR
ncbi:hypothetical protein GCM10009838_62140 [Catenulispora subtropica]|uniref:ATP/GTP-binding protein n=1 Tax=Catenulispora subtropica TaxID=450798 RepID=A0ABN2SQ53_9ACTN